jgi:hypothetical protein
MPFTAMVCSALFVGFSLVVGINLSLSKDAPCACFGEQARPAGWRHVGLTVVLALLAILAAGWPGHTSWGSLVAVTPLGTSLRLSEVGQTVILVALTLAAVVLALTVRETFGHRGRTSGRELTNLRDLPNIADLDPRTERS